MAERLMKDSGIKWIGEIPEKWSSNKIKDDFNVFSGATPKSDNPEYWDGDIRWITPADFKTEDVYIQKGSRNISREGYNSCGTTIVPSGSIIFSKRAPIGTVGISSSELCTNQGCLSCVPKAEVDSKFYYYLFSVLTEQFNLYGTGTTFKEISFDNFVNFKIITPSEEEQVRIADFLDKKVSEIDAVISKTKESIEDYKKLKQSIITEAVTKGLDPNVEMKESGIEWIGRYPETWITLQIKYASWLKGRIGWDGLKSTEYTEEGPYLITGTDFKSGAINWSTCVHITKERFDEDELLHIKEGDLLITKDGTVGKLAIVKNCPAEVSLNSGVLLIRNNRRYKYDVNYMYYVLMSNQFKLWYELSNVGNSTIKHLYQEQFYDFEFTYPSMNEQKQIVAYLDNQCSKYDGLIFKKEQVIAELEQYKKSLIYEYVTGKKEV